MGLSLTGTALALGISRRMVAAYQSGEYPVPEKIAKLCSYVRNAKAASVASASRR